MKGEHSKKAEAKSQVKAAGSEAERLWLLTIFLHLANTKSWKETAKWMGLVPATVRNKIAGLEASLNAPLVDNDGLHALKLTDLGTEIAAQCGGASLPLLAAWTHAVRLTSKPQLLIATTGVGARTEMSEALSLWSRKYDKVPVVAHVRSSHDIGPMLDSGEVRLGLGRYQDFSNEDLVRIPYRGTTRTILVHGDAGLATAEAIDEKLGWVVPEAAKTSIAILTRELEHAPRIRFTVGTHDDVVALVRRGLAGATLSEYFLSEGLKSIPLRRWESPAFHGALVYLGPITNLADYEQHFVACFKRAIKFPT